MCPAVVRLIRIRFPSLLGNICPLLLPTELAAILAREKAVRETGLSPQEIGVFSIVPCSSLVTAASSPDGQIAPVLDGAFAIRDVYKALLSPMKELAGKTAARPLPGRPRRRGLGLLRRGVLRPPGGAVCGGGRHRQCDPDAGGD